MYVEYNVKTGRNWYHGVPYTWWWGMSKDDFLKALPDHIGEREPAWYSETQYAFELAKQ